MEVVAEMCVRVFVCVLGIPEVFSYSWAHSQAERLCVCVCVCARVCEAAGFKASAAV